MRTWLLVCAAALALAFAPCDASAGTPGIDLAWDTCSAEAATGRLVFACDSNQPEVTHRLAMTFRSPSDIPDFAGVSIVLQINTQSLTTPDWWRFGPGECRNGSFVFPAYTTSLGPTCVDIWGGHVTGGGFIESYSSGHVGRATLELDFATMDTLHVAAGTRYLAGAATLDLAHSVNDGGGDAACGGCPDLACLLLYSVTLYGYQPGEFITIETADWRQNVYWQASLGGQDPCWVATRASTWGAIKAMYR